MAASRVSVKNVHKSFGTAKILDGVSLEIATGRAYALLGPNGAGKTTLVRILATLLLPDSGEVQVDGHDALRDPLSVRRSLGCSLDSDRSFFMRLSATENLLFFAALHGLTSAQARRRASELLEMFALSDAAGRRVQEFSSGMKQKLSLARALLADPPVLILDEPTRGLDPLAAEEFRASVRHLLAAREKTILLVTHSLEEAVELAGSAAILFAGRLTVATGDWRGDLARQYRVIAGAPQ